MRPQPHQVAAELFAGLLLLAARLGVLRHLRLALVVVERASARLLCIGARRTKGINGEMCSVHAETAAAAPPRRLGGRRICLPWTWLLPARKVASYRFICNATRAQALIAFDHNAHRIFFLSSNVKILQGTTMGETEATMSHASP